MLRDGPRRFNDIERNVAGIFQHMLTHTLRGLEREGIVTRTICPPSRCRSNTRLDRSMSEPVLAFGERVRAHLTEFKPARRRFDERGGKVERLTVPWDSAPKRLTSRGSCFS